MAFGKTVRRVLVAHVLVVAGIAAMPTLRGCREEPPEQLLPISFVVEAATRPPAPVPPAPEPPEPEPPPEPAPPEPEPPAPEPEPPAPEPEPAPKPRPPRPEIQRSGVRVTRRLDSPAPRPTQPRLTPEAVRRMLGDAPSRATPQPAARATEDQAYIARVQRTMYQAWVQPVSANLMGQRTHVSVVLASDGSVRSHALKQSSGDSGLDHSALAAVRSVQRIPGAPDGFTDRHPALVIVFEVR